MSTSAILLAFLAIGLWSFLATFGALFNYFSPFLVVGVALCISGIASLFKVKEWRVPWKTLLVGTGGIFGYHFCYFSAFRFAPAIETNLLNYLWPLLIVVLSPLLLPGYKLHLHHIIGALVGLTGAALIATGGQFGLDIANLRGYLYAVSAAIIWACYSLLTKRLPPFPTAAVGGFCMLSGILSLGIYAVELSSGNGAVNLGINEWILLLLLGLGPMGAAFFAWDAALKRGDPRIIGSLSYLTPLLSTGWLVLIGGRAMTWLSALAMVLIVSGAVIGSLDLIRKPQTSP